MRAIALASMMALAACGDRALRGRAVPEGWPRPEFGLTDVDGREFDFGRETRGRVTVLVFGYTSCPDWCPAVMGRLAIAIRDLPGRSAVAIVFVGTDPEGDRPDRVRNWLAGFDSTFVGLIGSAEEVAAAAAAARLPAPSIDGVGPTRVVSHPSTIMLIDADDRVRAVYGLEASATDWRHDLATLIEAAP